MMHYSLLILLESAVGDVPVGYIWFLNSFCIMSQKLGGTWTTCF